MKWKNLLLGGALVGAFSVGALFAPIGKPTATTNNQPKGSFLPLVQTADEKGSATNGDASSTCPMTGGPMGSGVGNGNGMMGGLLMGPMHEVIADALGMTADEFQAARSEGKTVAELAKEKGLKVDDLVAKMIETRKATLEQSVKDGKMTQAQMDTMLKNMETMMKNMIENNAVGMMNGRGGMMGKGGQCGAANGSTSARASTTGNQQFN